MSEYGPSTCGSTSGGSGGGGALYGGWQHATAAGARSANLRALGASRGVGIASGARHASAAHETAQSIARRMTDRRKRGESPRCGERRGLVRRAAVLSGATLLARIKKGGVKNMKTENFEKTRNPHALALTPVIPP